MIGLPLVFIIAVPALLALLVIYSSRPDRTQYDDSDWDFRRDRYYWMTDAGLSFQLAGLTTVIGVVLDQSLSTGIGGVAAVLLYALGMAFGLARYRDHRWRSRRNIREWYHNESLLISLGIFAVAEIWTFLFYLLN